MGDQQRAGRGDGEAEAVAGRLGRLRERARGRGHEDAAAHAQRGDVRRARPCAGAAARGRPAARHGAPRPAATTSRTRAGRAGRARRARPAERCTCVRHEQRRRRGPRPAARAGPVDPRRAAPARGAGTSGRRERGQAPPCPTQKTPRRAGVVDETPDDGRPRARADAQMTDRGRWRRMRRRDREGVADDPVGEREDAAGDALEHAADDRATPMGVAERAQHRADAEHRHDHGEQRARVPSRSPSVPTSGVATEAEIR